LRGLVFLPQPATRSDTLGGEGGGINRAISDTGGEYTP